MKKQFKKFGIVATVDYWGYPERSIVTLANNQKLICYHKTALTSCKLAQGTKCIFTLTDSTDPMYKVCIGWRLI